MSKIPRIILIILISIIATTPIYAEQDLILKEFIDNGYKVFPAKEKTELKATFKFSNPIFKTFEDGDKIGRFNEHDIGSNNRRKFYVYNDKGRQISSEGRFGDTENEIVVDEILLVEGGGSNYDKYYYFVVEEGVIDIYGNKLKEKCVFPLYLIREENIDRVK